MNPGFFLEGMRDPGMNALRATAHQPPQMQKTHTIRNDVNLKKNTLQLHPNEANPQQYHLEFTFDASTECTVSIFYATVEHQDEGGAVRFVPTKNGTAHPCEQRPKGLGQVFRTKPEYALDTSLFAPGELGYNQAQARFPLIVCLEVAAGAATSSNVSSQTTYADIVPAPIKSTSGEGGEKLTVRPLKQKIQVGTEWYELQEIYGMEGQKPAPADGAAADEDADDGRECVICMTEVRDTTVLPCRHMCMCSDCAKVLRFQSNKCPVCRTPIESLLQIKVQQPKGEAAAPK